ncbi:hypothetical protein XELAEV_18008800mg [Xenopus laevis]|uniref:Uncharacterized protein n=1 Tax=Xenopus laevis TaxID=8355 RepID=A0A974DR85_XENLA|nr:hypothetical protein XELAEV_18008800mg [Xenopus laevis]
MFFGGRGLVIAEHGDINDKQTFKRSIKGKSEQYNLIFHIVVQILRTLRVATCYPVTYNYLRTEFIIFPPPGAVKLKLQPTVGLKATFTFCLSP